MLVQISKLLSRLRPSFSLNTHADAATLSRDPAVVNAYREDILVHSQASARMGTELTHAMAVTIERATGMERTVAAVSWHGRPPGTTGRQPRILPARAVP